MSLQFLCRDCWRTHGTGLDCVLESYRMRKTDEGREELEARRMAVYQKAAGEREAASLAVGLHWAQKHGVPYQALKALREGVQNWPAIAEAREFIGDKQALYLLLLGPTKLGKTVAASLVMADFCARWEWNNQSSGGNNASPVHFVEARELTHASAFDAEKEKHLRQLKDCRLLVLDDVGDEGTELGRGAVADILIHRGDNGRRTVVTSNLTREGFKQRYGEAVARRIREHGVVPDLQPRKK